MGETSASGQQHWRTTLSVLANRNFLPLWFGWGLSGLSVSMRNIALMKLVYEQTGSAGGVGLLVLSNILSSVVVTPFAGVLADRLDRKRLLIGLEFSRVALVLVFLWAHSPLAIYVTNFALSVISMLYFPTRSAVVPDIVEKDRLLDANSLDNSLNTLATVAGPLLGALVVDRASPQATFILSGAFYLLSALGLFLVRIPPPSVLQGKASLRAVYQEFVQGIRYARVNTVVSTLTIIYFVLLTGLGLTLSLDIVFAERVLSDGAISSSQAYSAMMAAFSGGMFVGSQFVRYLGRRLGKKQALLVGLAMISIDALSLALVRSLPAALAAKFARGVGGGISMSLWPTLLQENVKESQRGRAFSLFIGVVSIPPALTVYLGGWLADHSSLQLVYGLTGCWVLLTALGSRFLPGYRKMAEGKEG